MKYLSLMLAACVSVGALCAAVGCEDRTVQHERTVDTKPDGTTVSKDTKVTEKSDGTVVKQEDKQVDK